MGNEPFSASIPARRNPTILPAPVGFAGSLCLNASAPTHTPRSAEPSSPPSSTCASPPDPALGSRPASLPRTHGSDSAVSHDVDTHANALRDNAFFQRSLAKAAIHQHRHPLRPKHIVRPRGEPLTFRRRLSTRGFSLPFHFHHHPLHRKASCSGCTTLGSASTSARASIRCWRLAGEAEDVGHWTLLCLRSRRAGN